MGSAAALPSDVVILISFSAVSEETRSNIVERLSERRRGPHEEALASMGRELAGIGRVRLGAGIRRSGVLC